MLCDTCKTECSRKRKEVNECMWYEPMTNADRIRAMSDEELSVFLWGFEKEEICREGEFFITRRKLNEWLKQPAE